MENEIIKLLFLQSRPIKIYALQEIIGPSWEILDQVLFCFESENWSNNSGEISIKLNSTSQIPETNLFVVEGKIKAELTLEIVALGVTAGKPYHLASNYFCQLTNLMGMYSR